MTMFGPYRVADLLGSGGMGEVHRAFDTVRERDVALKRLRRDFATDPEFQARFRRESRLAARLSSPHVIPIHDFGEIDGQLYIDMRLAGGDDLQRVVRRDGPLEPARAAAVLSQVADALDAAHADGLVHRDVKPSNVLLSGSPNRDFAYLVDFGIVRALDGGKSTSITATGAAIGTVAYMAPELFTEGRGTPASDVYALACLLYETLTGRSPFEAPTLIALMYQHLQAPPPKPSQLQEGVPTALDAVIAQGMAKDPADRPASAGALATLAVEAAHRPRQSSTPTLVSGPDPSSGPLHPAPSEQPTMASTPGPHVGNGPAGPPGGPGPPGPPGPPLDGAGTDGSRRRLVLLIGAGLVVLLAVTVGVAVGTSSGGGSGTASPTTTAAPTTSVSRNPIVDTGPASSVATTALVGQTYTVGGKDFDEQLVLCKMSILLLQSRGATVNDRCGIQGSAATRAALLNGQIDVTWNYTGTGWTTDLGRTTTISDSQALYSAVRDADASNGITWLPPTPFNNTYGIATTRAFAQQNGLRTLSDWARFINSGDADATTCAEPEFAGRDQGLPGLLREYGVTRPYTSPPALTTLDTGVVYQAVANGNPCKFGEVFTTDGRLPGLDLVALTDDRNYFPIYNASPEFRTSVLARNPAAGALLSDIARRLDDTTILALNGQISSEGRDPAEVARGWLQGQGLIA